MNWRKVTQLTLVHVGVSITVVPVTSTLNRVMIADLGMSALLVATLIALPYLLSPLQVPIGSWADSHPLGKQHRTPWIVLGGLMAASGSYMTAHAAYWLHANFATGLAGAVGAFTLWGLGVNMASVSYLSLLTEQSTPQWRSRAVSVMWTTMILSTITTSLLLARMLTDYSPEALWTAFGTVWLIATILVLVGSYELETETGAQPRPRHNHANNSRVAIRVLTANPVARRFFVYLVLILVSIHAQDVLLEPFAAEAMALSVSVTSRLTSIWGFGFLISMLGSVQLVRRWGKKRSANVGALVAALAFGLIAGSGLLGQTTLFTAAVLLLGLGGGLMTLSNLSFMLDMTLPQAAGLYIGAWGVANFIGQALGNIVSGLLRDLIFFLTGDPLFGYVTVFGLEVVGLLVAIWLFRTISVEEFQQNAQVRLPEILAFATE